MSHTIKIGDKVIGYDKPCFIIAEAGVNHIISKENMKKLGLNSTLEVAFLMVDKAKEAGVDAIKFQSFNTEKLQLHGIEKPDYQTRKVGKKVTYFQMLKHLETSQKDQIKIAEYCKKRNIMFLSTPYDNENVDFLDEKICVNAFKLASIELNNHLFTKYVGAKGKPIILSTGLSTFDDVANAIEVAKKEGYAKNLILLQCTSDYPAKPEEVNLNILKVYIKEFSDILFGLSDHTPTDTASIGAVALGAVLVEKHFTISRDFEGPDHAASLEADELKTWVEHLKEIQTTMGSYKKDLTKSEKKNLNMRKFIVINPQKKETIITEEMLIAIRTGSGLLPTQKNLDKIIGKKLKHNVKNPSIFNLNMVK
ncbi:MAG: N-acetylneuraminate synthase family protein [archaeon]